MSPAGGQGRTPPSTPRLHGRQSEKRRRRQERGTKIINKCIIVCRRRAGPSVHMPARAPWPGRGDSMHSFAPSQTATYILLCSPSTRCRSVVTLINVTTVAISPSRPHCGTVQSCSCAAAGACPIIRRRAAATWRPLMVAAICGIVPGRVAKLRNYQRRPSITTFHAPNTNDESELEGDSAARGNKYLNFSRPQK